MRNKILRFLAVCLVITCTGFIVHLFWLSGLKGEETYPSDSFLKAVSNKTALIITAHDDDAVAFSGTVRQLVEDGWKVHYMTFYGNWRPEDNPVRKQEAALFSDILGISETELIDFDILKTDTVKEPWMPVQYKLFANYFRMDSLRRMIDDRVQRIKPSVIFTLDEVMGGYGHPQHVCVSKCIHQVCDTLKSHGDCPVQRIYQCVMPPSQNERIVGDLPVFRAAKEVYETEGMPLPDVEISITDCAAEKMSVMRAFESQKRNLKKFWPSYNLYPSWVYFGIFDREYFHIVELT
ncbi:MAG: hypothetical protein RL220_1916 [Bacteroidota bacterium]|jgi:LmbE family N-acetylglucosaminyl deacetylase